MKYFYDTEFHENGHYIDLISIGIIAEDGREYYAINASAQWRTINQHPWLSENVVPHLPEPSSPEWKMKWQIRDEVAAFLAGDDSAQLWAWYSAYDHVALAQLFGTMMDLPQGVPMYTNDVRSLVDFTGITELPKQGGTAHDALDDARHVKAMHDHIVRALTAREFGVVAPIRTYLGVEKSHD
ncbi:3'-5' exoribonuclease [Arthrobacter sp. StoSoilB22]|uniref:3'-5' exoribonuclease domain-containing protein n=1 Tax=Arthrobacter sp. StoSoilB22 TaxID=2830996 RepID=UPI001CC336B1|nr:3'-5' exoribonuclease [Arthrobacter sp. StoSoilB22]BCW61866.1 3'-5' exoribonuclease [Arthrobacter sp. StoSoilB22]